jgi:hypothetical protein
MMRGLEGVGRERESVRCVWGGQHIAMRGMWREWVKRVCSVRLVARLGAGLATGCQSNRCRHDGAETHKQVWNLSDGRHGGRAPAILVLSLSLSRPLTHSHTKVTVFPSQNFIFNESPDHRQEHSGTVAKSVSTNWPQGQHHDALCAHVRGSVQQPWVVDTTSAWDNV